ncbi:hypothetical protein GCM10009430_00040 [Aquimarina litoralis]|uniref:Carrier domain-containing protein n=1 Tax=Aquimarina litoralis TaxID=584605 RepID=A0ABN1IEK8_9FLAO
MKNNVSNIQKYIWLDQVLSPNSPKHNIGGYVIINGKVNPKQFINAMDILLKENDIFSFVFEENHGMPIFYNLNSETIKKVEYLEIENMDEVIDKIQYDFSIPFNLNNEEQLFKMWLIKVSSDRYVWYSKLHHIISDGFSFQLLFNEVNRIYEKLDSKEGYLQEDIETNTTSYHDFIISESSYRKSKRFSEDRNFWNQRYNETPSFVYSGQNDQQGHCSIEFSLSEKESIHFWNIIKENKLSVFHLFLGCFSIILSKYYYKDEINLGMPILNRKNRQEKRTLGPFISLLPLKLKVLPETTFFDFITYIKKELFACYRHQSFQQADILKDLPKEINKLYDVRLSYEKMQYESEFSGNSASVHPLSNSSEDDPISIHVFEYEKGHLKFRFDINEKYVPKSEVEQLIKSFKYVLTHLESLLSQSIDKINIANEEQLKEVQEISNGLNIQRANETFLDLWNRKLSSYNQFIAVTHAHKNLTYTDLDKQANNIAGFLQNNGVCKGDRIGVMLSRSEKSIVSILGVLKAGGVYVPIDNNYPDERKEFIYNDSNIKLVLVDSFSQSMNAKNEYNIDEILEGQKDNEITNLSITKDDVAYIIYTSGSTGNPKGVVISHESLYDYIITFKNYFKLTNNDKVLQQASPSFDTSVEEIFPILAVGGNLVIANDTKDFHKLFQECEQYKISILSTNPFVLQYLNENVSNYDHNFRVLISGGDTLKFQHVNNLISKYEVYNTYGPTESTVCATYHQVENKNGVIPIGKPIPNRGVYVLDNQNMLPKGAIGEIGLSGVGLAIEYLNQKDLTENAFIKIDGDRIYKTGDLGKWDNNNNLIFYGRKDKQLSYKGYRIEVEEIESAIQKANIYIIDSYVCIDEVDKMPILIAYLVANESFVKISSLAIKLKEYLPAYMIPTHFVVIDAMPLLPNGKIDIKNLPQPKVSDIKDVVELPTTEEEKEIAAIWKELLNLDQVDVNVSFFELGGHSLLANQFISNIRNTRGIELSLNDFYKSPTIKELGLLVPSLKKNTIQKIITPDQEFYPLSYSQDRLWFLNQLDNSNTSYNVSRAIKLKGEVDVYVLEKTFTKLIEKHEILRTIFVNIEGEPYQKILSPYDFIIPVTNYKGLTNKEIDKEIQKSLEKVGKVSFEIEKGPLFRVELLKFSPKESVLIFCEHHLILDGWTQGILFRDFVDIYNELKKNPDYNIKKPELSFKDYAYWEKSNLNDEVLNNRLDYWEEKLQGVSSELPILLDRPRPKKATQKGQVIEHIFTLEFSEKLRQFSESQSVSLFITMITAFKIVLSKYSNQNDICVGTAVANRHYKEFEEVLGMIVNTIALRTIFDDKQDLVSILNQVKDTCLDAYAYENTPFGKVVERLKPKRSLNLQPLFQHMFSFVNVPVKNMSLLDAEIEIIKGHNEFSKFDISVVVNTVYEQADFVTTNNIDRRISIEWDYNSDIFDHTTMQRMLSMYLNVLSELVTNPTKSLKSLNYLSEAEKNVLLYDFNATTVAYPMDKTIVDLFKDQVAISPNATALVYEGNEFSYRELDELSNQLAHYLIEEYGVGLEDLVGVKLERTEWLVVSLLGVLKSGAAYVPIDPSYPEQRISYIEKDSNCRVTIDNDIIDSFREEKTLPVTDLDVGLSSSNLAYVIYTSGSTGKPKGVMIEHKSLVNLCSWHIGYYGLDATSRGTLYAGVGFDASVWEVYPYLLSGGSLYPISRQEIRYNISNLVSFIQEHNITHCYLPTKVCEGLYREGYSLEGVKILTGGEALQLPNTDRKGLDIYNNYGPSENTVVTASFNLEHRNSDILPIGSPISNTQIYILSEDLELQPVGVVGELCISGSGLSRGYLNNEELTSEKFIIHPFVEGERMYKTGDLARWLPDGTIEFLGRKDDQVKIRGYRIELGEIEHVLQSQDGIVQSIVIVDSIEGDDVLVSYMILDGELDKQSLRASLMEDLPDYMIPSYYVTLDEIPLTANGKVDKKALPKVDSKDLIQQKYVAAETSLEKDLVSIWQEVLGIDNLGVTDNFFELGGHSLKVTLLVNKIKRELSYEIQVQDVFNSPTIRGLVSVISGLDQIHSVDIPKALERSSYPLTSSQRRIWVLSQFEEGSKAYNIPTILEIDGDLDEDKFGQAFTYLLDRHESLRTVFRVDDCGEVGQYIVDTASLSFEIDYHDMCAYDLGSIEVCNILSDSYNYRFDLGVGPLIHVGLIKLASDRHLLALTMHHIISDGWSMEVLHRELITVYNNLLLEEEIKLPELSIQYKDYAVWQNRATSEEGMLSSQKYWLENFKGNLPVLELPISKSRPNIKTYQGDSYSYGFSKDLSLGLERFSEQYGASLFMVLMAGVNGLLSRYTDSGDIILGTPIAGRSHPDLEHQVGLYLNTLAIRTLFDTSVSFDKLLDIQKQTLLSAYSHQDYPFDLLVDELGLHHDTSRSALFDVMVVLQNQQGLFNDSTTHLGGLEVTTYKGSTRKVSQFDMSFIFFEGSDGLGLTLEYNTDLYDRSVIERFVLHLENFLLGCLEHPTQNITTIDFIDKKERQRLLCDFNMTSDTYIKDDTIVDLFRDQVQRTPEAVALVYGEKKLSYSELDQLSNQLAHYLIREYHVGVEDLVGVKLERNEWLVISLLAVLKTGGAYVPIDPTYPKQRIAYIEKDSDCSVTIDKDIIGLFKEEKELPVTPPKVGLSSSNLAYVIYTSGSTGKPKGVMIEHRNAVALLNWSIDEFMDTDFDVLYAVTSHCFDLSVYEIFYPLSIGKRIRLLENGLSIGDHLVNDDKVLLNTVPSVAQTLMDKKVSFENVVGINLAGEPFPLVIADYFKDSGIVVRNLYGPSEDTTYSTIQKVEGSYKSSVPIGKPLANTQVYILSDGLELQPIGVVGELCISGAGLSRGYLNKETLTNEKFITNPFKQEERMYKTGDLARWLSDGSIEFLGRKDDQVKIRGYRIELGEISHVIQSQEGIVNSIVIVDRLEGEDVLVSYIVTEGVVDTSQLCASLKDRLPDYMVPSYYVELDAIPLTPNGKVDKNNLPGVNANDVIKREYVAPNNPIEEQLVNIWQDTLGVDKIGVTNNFFELGGHSLKATVLINKINAVFSTNFSIQDLYETQNIQGVATKIKFITFQNQLESNTIDDLDEVIL